jgi:hypothetical protein
MITILIKGNEFMSEQLMLDSFDLHCNQTKYVNGILYSFMNLRNIFQKVIESNGEAELINEFFDNINDNILRTKALSRQSSQLNYSMNTVNYGKTFIEMLLNSNNILKASINCRIESETIQLQTNEEVTKYMTLILERLHSLYNDLLMDNFTPLNDESIRNLFHHAHQSFAAFIPLFKLLL